MAKSKKKKKKTQGKKQSPPQQSDAWLPTRGGLIVLGILSLGMAGITFWQSYQAFSFLESLGYALVYGGSIWAIFLVIYLVNTFLRGR
jgi:hypothetical protein